MPPRGKRQGFKIGRNQRRYWIASQARRQGTMDFPDKSIQLPHEPDMDETLEAFEKRIDDLCTEHTARLDAWIDNQKKVLTDPQATRTRYDGSVRSACRIFQEHTLSPFNTTAKFNTQKTYLSSLRLIEATVGACIIPNVTVPQVRYWYNEWRAPDFQDDIEHIKRAHEAVSMFRQAIYFLASLRKYAGCRQLAEELKLVQFEKSAARTQEITYSQVVAFCDAADEMAAKSVIPAERAMHMKIGVVAQFDTILRQKDIIGEWANKGAKRKLPLSITVIDRGHEAWAGYFTWENIYGWRWVMKTSKSGYRLPGDFRLQKFSLLFPLLDAVPLDQRVGPIVKGEHGLPIRQRSYGNWFRDIARWAGIPDDVWNMDSRAGGATEAKKSGAKVADIQGALTHTEERTTRRYIRSGPGDEIDAVADARAKGRKRDAKKSSGGTL